MALAKQLELEFPSEIIIYAMEIADPHTIGGGLTEPVRKSIGRLISKIKDQLHLWENPA